MGGVGTTVLCSCSYSCSYSCFRPLLSLSSRRIDDKSIRPHAMDNGIGDGTNDASSGVRERGTFDDFGVPKRR